MGGRGVSARPEGDTYEVQIIFRDGTGTVVFPNVVETYTIGEGPACAFAVLLDERTATGNLRLMKYPWAIIRSIAGEHRDHLGSTKKTEGRTA